MSGGVSRRVAIALALLVTVYGGLLRLDALVGKYGPLDHPAWARIATRQIAPYAASLRPSGIAWPRVDRPYVGGDPINYLKFAREMRGFYQAHVREPVFLALTRGWLWALGGQDAAVSFASLSGSTLATLAIYLVGSALGSRWLGLLAALLWAIEYEVIGWAPDGWRDDTFTATVLFTTWALIRVHQQPVASRAVLAGVLGGLACLTRITALSFVLPALLWLILAAPRDARLRMAKAAGIAFAGLTIVVAPYLVSCAMATGDPFYALNYHTMYYSHAEGRPIDEPISAAEYVVTRLREHPVATLDTAFGGLFVQPFITKWHGFQWWLGGLDAVLRGLALVGIGGLAFLPAGRLMLLVLLASLAPYMLTWNVGGGNEWRFTMHAYPFYIIAAAWAAVSAVALAVAAVRRDPLQPHLPVKRVAARAGFVGGVALFGTMLYFTLPWFVAREAIANNEATSIETGPRDLLFYGYGAGWSPSRIDGIQVRVSRGDRSVVRLPLPAGRDYDIALRLDPVDPAIQHEASVLFNRYFVGRLRLTWDPERVGAYRVRVRAGMVQSFNQLTIVPDTLVQAGSAGPRFAWLEPDDRIGVRLWYVRVTPTADASGQSTLRLR